MRTAAATATILLLAACAQPAATGAAGSSPSSAPPSLPSPGGADDLLLRVASAGGFVTPDMRAGRLPTTSVYADGRVIFLGPEPAIYPGPAVPNVVVASISPERARQLVTEAGAAGLVPGADFGRPGVADVPTTQFTVGETVVGVEALNEARADDPQLTAAQKAARTKVKAFLTKLDDLTNGFQAQEAVPYTPEILAAVVSPYVHNDDSVGRPRTVEWPGPALPGLSIADGLKLSCVTATGAERDAVLKAAKEATQTTPWVWNNEGYAVRLRPLLPDETGCDALKSAS
ncbi:hypothetical protein [Symbioplanes lichenis]|uniref:hypothetical protein n=1 Tax=Symbioplanes lichenis TaxID=1629072 RepID=UPI0027388147|nr:hypothetical protein [Actinoplanes lichenis]